MCQGHALTGQKSERASTLTDNDILTGRLPTHINLLLIGITPKSDGGERPVGVVPTVLRALDRWYRWNYGAEWLNRQPCLYGNRGRTVEDAIWRQGILAEWAAVAGKVAATYLLDISKDFEHVHVRHDRLWHHAHKHGFPFTLFNVLPRMFQMPRRLQLYGDWLGEVPTC